MNKPKHWFAGGPINDNDVIWRSEDFIVMEWQSRFYLYRVTEEYYCAELINGQKSLERQHKGKFNNWIAAVKKRDMNRLSNIVDQVYALEREKANLSKRWMFVEC